jgi:hypothetical protein
MSDYLKTFRKAVHKSTECDISDICDQSPRLGNCPGEC